MQIDIVFIGNVLVILFLTGAVTTLFAFIYKKFGGIVLERLKRFKNEFQVDIVDCIHTDESGLFIHFLELNISNNKVSTMRIDNISLFDKQGRELNFITRGHTSPITEFEINGNETEPWRCFCQRQPTGESDQAKLKLVIEKRGKRTTKKNLVSTIVPKRKFPTGEIMIVF